MKNRTKMRTDFRFRYDKELSSTRWSTIRKGAAFGIFSGWLSLGSYAIYTVGFIFGSILMIYERPEQLNFTKILIVSCDWRRRRGKHEDFL